MNDEYANVIMSSVSYDAATAAAAIPTVAGNGANPSTVVPPNPYFRADPNYLLTYPSSASSSPFGTVGRGRNLPAPPYVDYSANQMPLYYRKFHFPSLKICFNLIFNYLLEDWAPR